MLPPTTHGTHCGLEHAQSYHRNTGKWAHPSTMRRLMISCESWAREVSKVQVGTPGLADHALVGRMWDAHLADLGVE